MTKKKAQAIADAAEMIVGGFAVLRHDLGFRIVNLNTGHVAVLSKKFKVLESSMDAIEESIAKQTIVDNLEFLAA